MKPAARFIDMFSPRRVAFEPHSTCPPFSICSGLTSRRGIFQTCSS